ncbi:hypothetical protein BKA65DRAFT_408073 [Rhexocercosporidium sp. MPI-PUGE-AT-0058]|nr:hypothetical protein BKA65DRAFT_408073 [Rhexocercosporidium sp. MPI-PUGE-AT-0058]
MKVLHFIPCFILPIRTLANTEMKNPTCTTDNNCNLNGLCHYGSCICDPGWKSSDCGALDLIPAPLKNGYKKTGIGTSSWGSRIIHRTPDSRIFDPFLAEFAHDCGLDYWSPYSRIIHATSSTGPSGPYEFAAEVVGTFAHNPTVVYSHADGKYLMYYIGCPYTVPETCTSPNFTCGPGNTNNGESGISVSSSSDLKTWTSHGQILLGTDDDAWDADVTNPSPFPLYSPQYPTGEIALAYRGCPYNCSGAELVNLAVAGNFLGPYRKVQKDPIFENPNEDPFLWRDKRGNFHMLLHSLEEGGGFGDGPKVGRHAFSRTLGGPWTFNSRTLAFNTTIEFGDGSSVEYFRRERPQLFFSEDGKMTPLYLTTGVQEKGEKGSYTVVQPLKGAPNYEKRVYEQ